MKEKNSAKPKRHRGYLLTPAGAKKIQNRISELEEKTGIKYNANKIAERTQLISSQGLHPTTIRKILRGTSGSDEQSLRLIFKVFQLELEEEDYTQPGLDEIVGVNASQDWGEAVDVSVFYGRDLELELLKKAVISDRCRLVLLLGMGGIGKTSLSVKLGQLLEDKFEFLIWRSLRNGQFLEEILIELLDFFGQNEIEIQRKPTQSYLSQLIYYLRSARCLLILDNFETILKPGSPAGSYREGYEDYGEFLRAIAETNHQSCVILTGREKPQGISALEGENAAVRVLSLKGLPAENAERIFIDKNLQSLASERKQLIDIYQGNPLALKIVATSIQEIFAGNVGEFLGCGIGVFNGIRSLLEQQFERLAPLEKQILFWLAINREPVSLNCLREDLRLVSSGRLLEAIEFIGWRSLIEIKTTEMGQLFTLQPVVMEYVTGRLIEGVCGEIRAFQESENLAEFNLFKHHALMKAEVTDAVRFAQKQIILQQVIEELLSSILGLEGLIFLADKILEKLRLDGAANWGYVAGNTLNLLVHLGQDLSGYNLAGLTILQAYLKGLNLRGCNFTGAHVAKSIFSENFGNICSMVISPDGVHLATSHGDGEVCLWVIADGKLLFRLHPHTGAVWGLNFSGDGEVLVSGSFDGKIQAVNVKNPQIFQLFQAHTDWVWGVDVSPLYPAINSVEQKPLITSGLATLPSPIYGEEIKPKGGFSGGELGFEGGMIASCSSDRTVKIWEQSTGLCIKTLEGHTDIVQTIAFCPTGRLIASGSADRTIRLWYLTEKADSRSVNLAINSVTILHGHRHQISAIAFSLDGKTLASCDGESIKIWDVESGECRYTFEGNFTFVWRVAFCFGGKLLALGDGKLLKVLEIESGECRCVFAGFSSQIWAVSWNEKEKLLAANDKQMVKLWRLGENGTFHALQTIQSYTNSVYEIAVNENQQTFVSAGADGMISLWNQENRQCLRSWQASQKSIRSLAFSGDGEWLASGSEDKTIAIWKASTGQQICRFIGHTGCVWGVHFHPQEKLLASASADGTLRLWDVSKNRLLKILQKDEKWVLSVVFSGDGKWLASSSAEGIIRVWDLTKVLAVEENWESSKQAQRGDLMGQNLTFSSLASPSNFSKSGRENAGVKSLFAHQGLIWSLAFRGDGKILVSGGEDGIVKLWEVETGLCEKILQGHQSLVLCAAFQKGGNLLATGSADRTIRLWDSGTGRCLKVLEGPRGGVWSVGFSGDGKMLMSGSLDETIKCWDVEKFVCVETLRPARICEGMNITSLLGLTEAQKATLKALGAVENVGDLGV
ncbi:NB-ARC domain-containing protein [Ancylothrix sp. C2]|uniref:WD40 repeat domain-containing protein n=1 Tax=Ancylothrix sp. D3o TaxID=2953691 RepID=UPI0021BAE769|nr:NB-ARC domain-containing protein [Ancylothrix sp. D3o]MCT7952182.1 NB-ARC domain-containing protein [Ancylothrix sp. D3o]